jgi:hypothetical protein
VSDARCFSCDGCDPWNAGLEGRRQKQGAFILTVAALPFDEVYSHYVIIGRRSTAKYYSSSTLRVAIVMGGALLPPYGL